MLAAFALFAAALAVVVVSGGPPGIDERAARAVADHREQWLTDVLEVATRAGEYTVLVPLLAIAGLWLWRSQRSPVALVVFAATLAGASLLSNALKLVVARARPEDAPVHVGTYAFPSGHATAAAAAWLSLAIVLGTLAARRSQRAALLVVALVVVASVGLSRVYLGVHYVTDVLAGWALGGLWALVVLALADRRVRER